jgi:hypothetical protein
MSNEPSNSTTRDESASSEVSLRHYYRGNIYEIFYLQGVTHAQIHFPAPSSVPSASTFNDFPHDVQEYFRARISEFRARRPRR